MILSTFLAKLLGLYFIIIALLWFFRHKQVMGACREVVSSKGLLAISAEFSLIFGLVIAIDHTIWELNWQGLLTVLGYLLILRGVLRLAFPVQAQKYLSKVMKGNCWIFFTVILILGAYLTYCGFAFSPEDFYMGE